MSLPPLILASASPRRVQLLQQCGLEFQVVPSAAEELHNDHLTACELAQINAFRKARPVAKQFPNCLVLGADTLVYLGSALFGKPQHRAEARRMLERLQGQIHQVVTGVCLMHWQSRRARVFADVTEVRFRPLNSEEIDGYLESINPLDKAGAYAIQEGGERLVEQIAGSHSNVVGLPIERLQCELAAWETRLRGNDSIELPGPPPSDAQPAGAGQNPL